MRIGDPWGGKREEIALGPQLYLSNCGTSKHEKKERRRSGRDEKEKGEDAFINAKLLRHCCSSRASPGEASQRQPSRGNADGQRHRSPPRGLQAAQAPHGGRGLTPNGTGESQRRGGMGRGRSDGTTDERTEKPMVTKKQRPGTRARVGPRQFEDRGVIQ